MHLERGLAGAEDVRTLTAHYLADQPAAVPGAPHDLLERDPILGQRQDGGVRLLAPEIALALQALSGGKQCRIDGRRADRVPDPPHGRAHRVEERAAGVLHQVPSVGDLNRMRESIGRCQGVPSAAIPGDDGDLRLLRQPRLGGDRFPIRQQGDRLAPLQVADDRAVALVAAPSPVIDSDHRWRDEAWTAMAAHHPQQGVVADRQHQPAGEPGRGAPAQGEAQMMDDVIEPGGPPCPGYQDLVGVSGAWR